jgi:hypothetical protein
MSRLASRTAPVTGASPRHRGVQFGAAKRRGNQRIGTIW